MPFFCSLFHLFRHSVPLFTSFCGFSLSTGTRDPITSYCFHLPVSHRLFVLPLDSLSLYTMNPEGFYLFFPPSMALPLSLIPHLHQLLSRPPSLSPLCFPSLFRSIVLTFTFCSFVIPYPAPHTTLPSPRPSSHISISYTLWHAIPLRSLRGTLLFPSFHWSLPSFRISTTDALAADTYVDGQISQTLTFILHSISPATLAPPYHGWMRTYSIGRKHICGK